MLILAVSVAEQSATEISPGEIEIDNSKYYGDGGIYITCTGEYKIFTDMYKYEPHSLNLNKYRACSLKGFGGVCKVEVTLNVNSQYGSIPTVSITHIE